MGSHYHHMVSFSKFLKELTRVGFCCSVKNPQLHGLFWVDTFSIYQDIFPNGLALFHNCMIWNKWFPLPNLFNFLLVSTSWLGFSPPCSFYPLFACCKHGSCFLPQDLNLLKLYIQELFITLLFLNSHLKKIEISKYDC